jgi:hypothetical protein
MNFKWVIVVLLVIYIVFYSTRGTIESNEITNGFYTWSVPFRDDMSTQDKLAVIRQEMTRMLSSDYITLDYIYYIQGCSLSTFHRDVTSSQHSYNTKYPTYTVVVYEYDGNFLSLCPNSEKEYPITWSRPVDISGKKYTAIIFNADILHAGQINTIGRDRKVIQFKVVHKDDYDKLKHLNGVQVDKIGDCNNSSFESLFREFSYHTSFIWNTISKKSDGLGSTLQQLVPLTFYNNQQD